MAKPGIRGDAVYFVTYWAAPRVTVTYLPIWLNERRCQRMPESG